MSTVSEAEKRNIRRVPTRLQVSLQWKNGDGKIKRTRGVTRDFSQRGVYCYVEDPIPAQHAVEFDVVIPVEMTAGSPLALHCSARTVRADTQERRFGIAATIESRQSIPLSGEPGTEAERRIQRRVRPPVVIAVEFPSVNSQIRDLSPTGAFIADERPFPLGRKLTLRFRLDESGPTIEVHAIVRRVDPQMGMAVEFIELTEEAAEILDQYGSQEYDRE
jgi:c-di-GMP-binding flagellar brake protein YcgR